MALELFRNNPLNREKRAMENRYMDSSCMAMLLYRYLLNAWLLGMLGRYSPRGAVGYVSRTNWEKLPAGGGSALIQPKFILILNLLSACLLGKSF